MNTEFLRNEVKTIIQISLDKHYRPKHLKKFDLEMQNKPQTRNEWIYKAPEIMQKVKTVCAEDNLCAGLIFGWHKSISLVHSVSTSITFVGLQEPL